MASRKRFTKDFVIANIHDILEYNPDTGELVWKFVDFSDRGDAIFNKKYAGKVAGNVGRDGYRNLQVRGWPFSAHRLAWYITYGKWPDNQIDHINGNRDDNRLCNLRDCTSLVNARNVGLRATNISGHRGVTYNKSMDMWQAYIWIKGKQTHLGFHEEKQSAVNARVTAEETIGGYTDASRTRKSNYMGV